jgi:uncharacterized membrane protein HdeD (DUF308 family)
MQVNDTDRRVNGRLLMGIMLIVCGLVLLADRLDIVTLRFSANVWPVIVLAFGIIKIVDPPVHRGVRQSRRSGAWLIYIGLWGLVNEFRVFGLGYATSWPLMIVGVGLATIWRSVEGNHDGRIEETRS